MKLTLTTPALLFSAISLLLLAYTNRFLAIAALVRGLRDKYLENPSGMLIGQIKNLRSRLSLIRNMQILGLASLLLCVLSMFLIYVDFYNAAVYTFGVALLLLILSLSLSIREIQISVKALNLHLKDIDREI
jgi:uncharacterized membrane protein YdfJ with MMPL/SSD domain